MKRRTRAILSFAFLAIMVAGFTFAWIAETNHRRTRTCDGLKVEIQESFRITSEKRITEIINGTLGTFKGQRPDSISLHRVEEAIKHQPCVKDCQAYITSDDTLHVEVFQRVPIIKVSKDGNASYVDEDGVLFPVQGEYDGKITVIEGNVSITDEAWLKDMVTLTRKLSSSGNWKDVIDKIRMEDGDIVLVSDQTKEKFVFGDASDLQSKFARMDDYVKYIRSDEKHYKRISVKYTGQIICK